MGRAMSWMTSWKILYSKNALGEVVNHSTCQDGTVGTVYNHDLRDGAPESFGDKEFLARTLGLYSYAIRAYVLTMPGDVFHVGKDLLSGLEWLRSHYKKIGLRCAENFIYSYDFKETSNHPDKKLSVFFYGPDAYGARPDSRRIQIVKFLNDKNKVIELADNLGVTTPETDIFPRENNNAEEEDNVCQVNVLDYDGRFPRAVKIADSVSGLGFARCSNAQDLFVTLANMPWGARFQIQEFMDGAEFLSVQFWVDENGVESPITGTCNFIEGDANHAGNWGGKDISHKHLYEFVKPLIGYAAEKGFLDWGSFDIAFFKGKCYVIECNPRYTGAAYPYVAVMRLLGDEAKNSFWAHRGYKTALAPKTLDLGNLEYDPETKKGWIVINIGPMTMGDGKLGMLYIGPEEEYPESEERLQKLLT